MAKSPTHHLVLNQAGQPVRIWKAYLSDAGIEIEYGGQKGRLKMQWIPASQCETSPMSECHKRAQEKLDEGYVHADPSQPADPNPQPATQAKASAGRTGINWSDGDWIY